MKFLFIPFPIIFFACVSCCQGIVLEYASNHLNQLYPRKIIMCKNQVIELTAPDDNNPENCYLWQPCPDEFKHQRTILVEPLVTTDYSIQITNYTTGENHTYLITIYVIDHIDLYEINNIPECMERRQLTIKGELIGSRMNEISNSNEAKHFIYLRKRIDNAYYPDHKWFPVVTGKFSTTLLAPLPNGPSQTMDYTAVFKAGSSECASNTVSIKVHRLWIHKFKDAEAPQEHFVVVDRSIHHEALASPLCHSFEWELKAARKKWKLINNQERQSGNILIETNSIIGKNTQDFGISYGIIRVSCLDDINQSYITYSSPYKSIGTINEPPDNRSIIRDMPQPFRASVFYKKDDPHPQFNYYLPNWFVFWRQGLGIPKEVSDIKFIDFNLPQFAAFKANKIYGVYQRPEPIQPQIFEANSILMTQLASEDYPFSANSELAGQIIYGIHNYYSTWTHELEHAIIFKENWPSGYDITQDVDLDYYNDAWEDKHKVNKFKVRNAGLVDYEDLYDNNNPLSNGLNYEESRCFSKEDKLVLEGKISHNDHLDWSYDYTNNFNGKQWKK